MKITVLSENISENPALKAEHGLSLYIETERHTILFDAGQSESFARNAEQLGVDLAAVDLAVLSHGHYDHGGGLSAFLEINQTAPVYMSRHAFGEHCGAAGNYIGLPEVLKGSDRVCFVDETLTLDEGLSLHACHDAPHWFPLDSAGLLVRRDGELTAEDFCHEQYLLVEEAGKRILISGCSHRGVLNIRRWFEPDVLVGGFHFMKMEVDGAGRASLEQAAAELLRGDTRYYTAHCTGVEQYRFLRERMGERLEYISVGSQIRL